MGTSYKVVCLALMSMTYIHGPSHLRMSHLHVLICLSESYGADHRKIFLVRLCYGDLVPDFTVHDSCPWSLPPEDRLLCHTCMHSLA